MKALSLIMKTVSPHIALKIRQMPSIIDKPGTPDVKCCPNAKEIWNHLQSQYQKTDAISSIYDFCQLLLTPLVDNGTLKEQLNNHNKICSHCALNGINLEDYLFTATILTTLPKSYSHITNSLLTHGKIQGLTVEGVYAKIVETEAC